MGRRARRKVYFKDPHSFVMCGFDFHRDPGSCARTLGAQADSLPRISRRSLCLLKQILGCVFFKFRGVVCKCADDPPVTGVAG